MIAFIIVNNILLKHLFALSILIDWHWIEHLIVHFVYCTAENLLSKWVTGRLLNCKITVKVVIYAGFLFLIGNALRNSWEYFFKWNHWFKFIVCIITSYYNLFIPVLTPNIEIITVFEHLQLCPSIINFVLSL